ncbi:NADH-quinone oxidoreductase subunit NuoG [Bartonella sp. DGB1]|uniref:NADH-quinone oxidoreductase subunit NuoG n=1 Tax=Bartonella sp. DGB1 TaxID=3239807 RepID=UPI003524A2DA
MIKIKIDNKEIEVPSHYTLLQAAEAAGVEIPRFCFHERLSIAGNCRMCLVEVKGGPPKPQASCALAVTDLRPGPNGEPPEVFTSSPMVKKARAGVMEFLLINHPLDCPICDQAGECDLQDQAMIYGRDNSRYCEDKRAVTDKYISPLIKTVMNRCIHCTRCVRFTTEVAGISELGLTGRGEDAEITTYLEAALTSELQGNVIDLCPVGALTSRPYSFVARPWELTKTESIDVMDALGCNIRIDTRGKEVLRILPRVNENINEEWISDKSRFSYDGLKLQRLDRPYVRKDGVLTPVSWDEAFSTIADVVKKTNANNIGAIAGDLAAVEEIFALKSLLEKLGSENMECRQDGAQFNPAYGRESYIFNSKISGIDKADAILLVGCNPREEAAILNARILVNQRRNHIPIGLIGKQVDLRYPYQYLGAGTDSLLSLIDGKIDFFDILDKAKNPLIIVGAGALVGKNGVEILAKVALLASKVNALREDWNGYNILHTAAARVGALDIGFVPKNPIVSALTLVRNMDLLFLLGADEVDLTNKSGFIVYIGTHGDKGAHAADVILPAASYTEKSATYVNTEGRVQMTNRANFPPGDAREDWSIICSLAKFIGVELPFDNINSLRDALYIKYPHLAQIDEIIFSDIDKLLELSSMPVKLKKDNFTTVIKNFYTSNFISRASVIMAESSALANSVTNKLVKS